MQKAAVAPGAVDPARYAATARAVEGMSTTYRNAMASSGMFNVQQMKTISQSERMTDLLQKQKLGVMDLIRNQKILKVAYQEQLALQRAQMVQWGRDSQGRLMGDLSVPNAVHKDLNTLGNRIGWIREQTRSAAQSMVNWGKNTQWAGRQLMVGFTMPVAAFGAVAGTLAYQADQQLTRIEKVYDTASRSMAGKERELSKLRADSMELASSAAREYGVAMNETLEVEAELAAAGQQGNQLMTATNQVMRVATLGEFEHADALKTVIALQQIMGYTSEETGRQLDYMNSIENATSLATEDFAKAIPVALGPLKEMGGNVQDLALLLVGMKERGIEAGEGANAIKAMMSRLYRPSKQIREEWSKLAQFNLTKEMAESGGDVMKFLPKIQDAVSDLSQQSRVKLLGGLFGTYQVARQNALLKGLEAAEKGIGQTSRVLEVNRQGWEKWGTTADGELARIQQSASGKFRIALETLKVELATMGEPFLEFGSTVLGWITTLVQKFNALPDAIKGGIVKAAIFAALVGPLIMLVGLTANFTGHILKLFVSMTGLATRFSILTKESVAARAATALATEGFITQTSALQMLNAQMAAYNASLNVAAGRTAAGGIAATMTPAGSAAARGVASGVPAAMTAGTVLGTFKVNDVNKLKTATAEVAEDTGKSARNSKLLRGGLIGAGVAAATMAVASGGIADDMGQWLMYAAILGPTLMAINWSGMATSVAAMATSMKATAAAALLTARVNIGGMLGMAAAAFRGPRGIIGGVTALGGGLKGGLKSLLTLGMRGAAMAGPAGWIAAAVAGVGLLATKTDDAADAVERMENSGSTWADILGFQHKEAGTIVDPKTGEEIKSMADKVNELRESAPELVDEMRNATNEQRALNLATRQGLEVYREGGSAAQAIDAARVSLMAAFDDRAKVERMMIQIKPSFRMESSVVRAEIDQALNQVEHAASGAIGHTGAEYTFDFIMQQDLDDLTDEARRAAEMGANTFYNSWSNQSRDKKIDLARELETQFDTQRQNLMKPFSDDQMGKLADMGITKVGELIEKYRQLDKASIFNRDAKAQLDDLKRIAGAAGVNLSDMEQKFENTQEAQRLFVQQWARQAGLSDEVVEGMTTIDDLLRRLVPGSMKMSEAQNKYKVQIAATEARQRALAAITGQHYKEMSNEQKLQILNHWRMAAGLQKTTNLADGFGAVTEDNTKKQKDQTEETEKTTEAQKELTRAQIEQRRRNAAFEEIDMVGKWRESMEQTQQDIADQMTASLEREEERAMDSLDRRQERQSDAFDRRTARQEAAFDRELEALDRTLERETRHFENEQERQSRQFDARQERELRQFDNLQERAQRRFDDRWEDRTDKVTQFYDTRIENLNNAIEAEERAEEIRQRIFEAEMTRIQRLAETASMNIDFNMALNSGDLDEAARISNDMRAQESTWNYEDAGKAGTRRTERITGRLQKRIESIEKERDTRIEALADMEEAHRRRFEKEQERERRAFENTQDRERRMFDNRQELAQRAMEKDQERRRESIERDREMWQKRNEKQREALEKQQENTREVAQREFEIRRRNLDKALEALQKFVPRNRRELKTHITNVQNDYGEFGTQLERWGGRWGKTVGNMLSKNVGDAARAIKSEIDWATIGERAAAGMISGAFDMNLQQFKRWVGVDAGITGPGKGKPGGRGRGGKTPPDSGRDWHGRPQRRHGGGPVGGAMRGGIPYNSNLFPSETMVRAKNDEYVMSGKAHRTFGTSFLDMLNSGKIKKNTDGAGYGSGGIGDGLGLVGPIAAGMAKTFTSMVKSVINLKGMEYQAAQSAMSGTYAAAKAGKYGDETFNAQQLRNAAIIANVGSRLGATKRDIITALSVAMVESDLINVPFGDRDSLGLFQQRAAWGPREVRLDPEKSAAMFFKGGQGGQQGLFDINGRETRSIGSLAQDVQVSAFPGRYATQVNEARAILEAMPLNIDTIFGQGNKYPGVEPVADWVREAAEYLGAKHNVGTIGGWRASSAVANSDHPKGLALDLMTNSFQQGNAIARTVSEMWKALDVTYMIWRQRIKTSPNGPWRRMEDRDSPTANHMDHVHLSFERAGSVSGLLRSGQAGEMAQGPGGRHRPVRGGRKAQGIHGSPPALDIALPTGRPVYAAHDGRVVESRDIRGDEPRLPGRQRYQSYGRYIVINGAGVNTLYAHLNQRYARTGQRVRGGTKIGLSGNTGYSYGPHLHFGAQGKSPYTFVPGLRDGGNIRWDNTLANLHKDETVLTAPLSRELEEGIRNLDSGGVTVYNKIEVHPAPGMDEEALAQKVAQAIERRKGRVGRSRTVGGR